MKRALTLLISASILLTGIFTGIPVSASGTEGGITVNGGFENGLWTRSGVGAKAKATLSAGGRTGSCAQVARTAETASPVTLTTVTESGAVFDGGKYCFEAYVKTSEDFNGVIYAELTQNGGKLSSSGTTSLYMLGSRLQNVQKYLADWTRISTAAFVPESGVITVKLMINGTGTVWIDDADITADPERGNLIENGGFERGIWKTYTSGGSAIQTDGDITDGSLSSAKFTGAPSGDAHITADISGVNNKKAYTLSVNLKSEGTADGGVYIRILQSGMNNGTRTSSWLNINATDNIIKTGNTFDWQSFGVTCKGFADYADSLVLYIYLEGEGVLWADSVCLKEITPVKEPKSGEVTASAASGEIAAGESVFLFTEDDSDIIYTTDGSDPRFSASSRLYDGSRGIIITEDTLIKAAADKSGTVCPVSEFNYKCGGILPLPGFESGIWNCTDTALVSKDNSVYASGGASMRLTAGSETVFAVSGFVNIDPYCDWRLSFKAKTQNAADNQAFLSVFLAGTGQDILNGRSGSYYKSQTGPFEIGGNEEWREYELLLSDISGGCGEICLTAGIGAGSGNVWFDDVRLTAVQENYQPLCVSGVSSVGNIYNNNGLNHGGFTVYNRSRRERNGDIVYELYGDDGKRLLQAERKISLASGAETEISYPLSSLEYYGIYSLNVYYRDENGIKREISSLPLSKTTNAAGSRQKSGVSSHAMTGGYLNGKTSRADIDEYIDLLAASGIRYVREEIIWSNIETSNGNYSFPEWWDTYIDSAVSHGIEIQIVINAHGCGDYGENLFPVTDAELKGFTDYAAAIVRKFKGRVKYYELFNETNYSRVTDGAGYAAMLKYVYPRLKAVDSDCKIIAGVLSFADAVYAEEILQAGGADYMDLFSFHPYTYPSSPEKGGFVGGIEKMRRLFENYTSKDIHFWLTEIGWSSVLTDRGVSETQKAQYHMRGLAAVDTLDYVDAYLIYETHSGGNAYSLESNWGMLEGPGNDCNGKVPYSAKELYAALSARNSLLSGYSFESRLSLDSSVYAYRYINSAENKSITVFWTDGENGTAEITLSRSSGTLYDMFGNETGLCYKSDGKTAAIPQDGSCRYLLLDGDITVDSISFTTENDAYMLSSRNYNNVLENSSFEDGLWNCYDLCGRTAELDTETAFDGEKSVKFTFGERLGATAFTEKNFTDTAEKIPLNTKYRLKIAAKATEGFKGQIFIRVIETETGRIVRPTAYNGEWYMAGKAYDPNASGDVELPTDWGIFTSDEFSLTGAALKLQVCVNGSGGSVWLDDVALVPTETVPQGGSVYGSYDSQSQKFTLKVESETGNALKSLKLYTGMEPVPELTPLFAGFESNNVAVYEYGISDISVIYSHYAAMPQVITEFEKAPHRISADVNGDGNVDIRDLIGIKKYISESTHKSPLYSGDINADGNVNAEDTVILRKQLLSN